MRGMFPEATEIAGMRATPGHRSNWQSISTDIPKPPLSQVGAGPAATGQAAQREALDKIKATGSKVKDDMIAEIRKRYGAAGIDPVHINLATRFIKAVPDNMMEDLRLAIWENNTDFSKWSGKIGTAQDLEDVAGAYFPTYIEPTAGFFPSRGFSQAAVVRSARGIPKDILPEEEAAIVDRLRLIIMQKQRMGELDRGIKPPTTLREVYELGDVTEKNALVNLTLNLIKGSSIAMDNAARVGGEVGARGAGTGAQKAAVHEIMHHLMNFVPREDLAKLARAWVEDVQDVRPGALDKVEAARNIPKKDPAFYSPENVRARGQWYRFTTAEAEDYMADNRKYQNFTEWFAEVMTDRAVREFYLDRPEYKSLIQKLLYYFKQLLEPLRLTHGNVVDDVYRRLMNGDYASEYKGVVDIYPPLTGTGKYGLRLGSKPRFPMAGSGKGYLDVEPWDRRVAEYDHFKELEASSSAIYPEGLGLDQRPPIQVPFLDEQGRTIHKDFRPWQQRNPILPPENRFVTPLGGPTATAGTMVPQSGPAQTGLFDMLGALQAERAGIQSRRVMPRLRNTLGDTGAALGRAGRNVLGGGGWGGRRGDIIDDVDSWDSLRSEMGSNLVDELLDANVRGDNAKDSLRWVANWLGNLPDTTIKGRTVGVGATLRTLINSANPSAIIERSPIRMEGLGYMLLEEYHAAQASQRLSALARSPFKKVIGDDGKITLLDKRRVEFGDVAQDMNQYAPFLTREQVEWIERGHELLDDMVMLYEKSTGREFPKLEMAQGMRYWPRWIETNGKYTAARGKVGAKAGILKKRFYDLQEDGVKGGVNYKKDPLEQVELYVHAIHKMIRDQVFTDRIVKKYRGHTGPLGPSGIDPRLARRPGPKDWKVIGKGRLSEQGEVRPIDYFKHDKVPIFREEDWKELQAFLPKLQRADLTNFDKLNKYAGSVSSLLRTLQAGAFDLGQFTIQGSILFFRSPVRWSKAVHGAFRAMIDPDFYMHWRQYSPESQLASKYGIDLGLTSEFFESGLLQSRVGAPIRPFQRSFETFIGMGRAYMFDGFAQTASRKASGNALEEELMRLARYTDTMLGVTSSRALGVSATQRSIENAWVFFSPRYTRSLFGVFSNTLAGGRVGVEARRALGQTLIGGALTYWGIGKAMGKSDEELLRGLNPLNGKRFLSYEIGGRWYGIGGGLRSMMALMAAPLDTDNVTGKFIYDWLRMRQPPVASSLIDILGGDTPMGVPMSSFFGGDESKFGVNKELLDYAQSKVLPFPIQAAYEMWGEEVPIFSKEMATAVGTEFLGGRTSGETFTDAANDEARALGWPEYRDAEPWQKAHLEQLERTKAAKEKRERYGLGGTIDDIESRFEARLQQIEADLILGNRVSEEAAVNKYYEEIGEMSKQKMGARMHEHGPGMGYREGDTPGEKALNEFFNIGRNEGEGKDYYDPGYQTEQQNAFMKQLRMSDLEAYEYVLRNTNIDYLGNLLGSKSKLRKAVEYHSSTGALARAKASRNARNKWKAENR